MKYHQISGPIFTRFLTLMFVVMLALPITTLHPPGESSQASWGESALAAKGKNHKKKSKNKKQLTTPQANTPQTTTVARTVRGPITQTFISSERIVIPNGAPGATKGNANPYPTTIAVSGFANGVITDVDLLINDFTHRVPEDVDILLSKDDGRGAMVMSDVGRIISVTDVDLTLDDEATAPLPGIDLKSGAFRPTDISSAGQPADTFDAPAPAFDGSVALSTFDGADPNGTWQLFVTDDASGDAGDIRGWALRITAEVDLATVDEQRLISSDPIQDIKVKKKGKGNRRRH